ncbi:unnamed protein product, partial [Ectocarpus sp. 13 AM-2016]
PFQRECVPGALISRTMTHGRWIFCRGLARRPSPPPGLTFVASGLFIKCVPLPVVVGNNGTTRALFVQRVSRCACSASVLRLDSCCIKPRTRWRVPSSHSMAFGTDQ